MEMSSMAARRVRRLLAEVLPLLLMLGCLAGAAALVREMYRKPPGTYRPARASSVPKVEPAVVEVAPAPPAPPTITPDPFADEAASYQVWINAENAEAHAAEGRLAAVDTLVAN